MVWPAKNLPRKKSMGGDGDYFVMEEKFITVVTQHFCLVAGTICDKEGCRRSLRVVLVGKLESKPQQGQAQILSLQPFA